MVKSPECDAKRMALYPNLDYKGLYNAIVQLVDIVHLIQYGVQGKSAPRAVGIFRDINEFTSFICT